MEEIMSGEATPCQTSALLVALKKKGVTVDEVTVFAQVMKEKSRRITPKVSGVLLDTCGTGGDLTKTFNVSTTSALVIAGAGVSVAKHGTRSFTSKCGSADLLESLGLNLEMSPERVKSSIEEVGIGFLYAPVFHPAMLNVATIRREIGVRTVFNILGPLTNPAGARAQLLGVYDPSLLELMCEAAKRLGCKSVMTVYALDGIDEIAITGKTLVAQVNGSNKLEKGEIDPSQLGLRKATSKEIGGSNPTENAQLSLRILSGRLHRDDACLQMVLLNAAAGLVLSQMACDLRDGLELARKVIEDGEALESLRLLVEYSGGSLERIDNLS